MIRIVRIMMRATTWVALLSLPMRVGLICLLALTAACAGSPIGFPAKPAESPVVQRVIEPSLPYPALNPTVYGPVPAPKVVPADPRIVACMKSATDKTTLMRCLDGVQSFPSYNRHIVGATAARIPAICTVQSIPAWFISRSGGDDGNSCTDAGHPCQHYYEIKSRWGCGGSPTFQPRTANTIVLTWTTPDPMDGVDPVDLNPFLENSASAEITVPLPTPVASGILAGVLSKARTFGASQLLTATLAGGLAVGDMIINTTHPSTGWLDVNISGNVWSLGQPIRPMTVPDVVNGYLGAPAEVDTWANGDSYSVYRIPASAVDLRSVASQVGSLSGGGSVGSSLYVFHVGVPAGSGLGALRILGVGPGVVLGESYFGVVPSLNSGVTPSQQLPVAVMNDYCNSGIAFHALNGMPGDLSGGVVWAGIWGGAGIGTSGEAGQLFGGRIDDDTILAAPNAYIFFDAEVDRVYAAAGALIALGGTNIMTSGGVAWGPGQTCAHEGYLSFQTVTAVGGLATSTLGIGITCTNVAFAIKTSAGISELSNLPLTAINLDDPNGFNGEAFLPIGNGFRHGIVAPPGTTQCAANQMVVSNGSIFLCLPTPGPGTLLCKTTASGFQWVAPGSCL
jgi:hypothetical protein